MNIKRAAISLLMASFVPGFVSMLAALLSSRSDSFLDTLVGLLFWFVFSAPIVFVVGFATLYFSLKLRGGPIFIPPVVGGIVGVIVAETIYAQGMNSQGLLLFTSCGVATSMAAMLIYFWPRKKSS